METNQNLMLTVCVMFDTTSASLYLKEFQKTGFIVINMI